MHIIHISFSLLNGGKENLLVDLANRQALAGNVVIIAIINNKVDENLKKRIIADVKFMNLNKSNRLIFVFKVLKFNIILLFINKLILHCHDVSLIKLLSVFLRKKALITLHASGLEKKLIEKYSGIVSISHAVNDDYKRDTTTESIVIYNGVDISKVKIKTHYKLTNEINIVQIGGLDHKIKGQDLLIKAARILFYEENLKNFKIHFIGDGNSFIYLQNLIEEFELTTVCRLYGNKDREWIYRNLSNFEILIQPSLIEGFGLTIAEAMIAGVPVIASNIEGPAELLGHGSRGFLFERADEFFLKDSILKVIESYRAGKISDFTSKSRNYAVKHFDINYTNEEYLKYYNSFIYASK